jgi:hypothetical protein
MGFSLGCSAATIIVINALLISNSVTSFRSPPLKRLGGYRHLSKHYSNKNEDGASDKAAAVTDNMPIDEIMKLFVTAIDEGREDELVKAGLKVTSLTPRAALDDKLSDPELRASILGSSSTEDLEMKKLLENEVLLQLNLEESGTGFVQSDIDPSIFAELQAEARETLKAMKEQGSGIAALLDDPKASKKGFGGKVPEAKSNGKKSVVEIKTKC